MDPNDIQNNIPSGQFTQIIIHYPSPLSEDQCAVCQDKSSGYHYGVLSCEGCKGFFRRSVDKSNGKEILTAYEPCEKNCVINHATRNNCRFCRLKRCLEKGMRPENIKPKKDKQKNIDGQISSGIHEARLRQGALLDVVDAFKVAKLDEESSFRDRQAAEDAILKFVDNIAMYLGLDLHLKVEMTHKGIENALIVLGVCQKFDNVLEKLVNKKLTVPPRKKSKRCIEDRISSFAEDLPTDLIDINTLAIMATICLFKPIEWKLDEFRAIKTERTYQLLYTSFLFSCLDSSMNNCDNKKRSNTQLVNAKMRQLIG